MEHIYENVAGLDVHQETVVVAVRLGGRKRPTRTFETTTGALETMRDWLLELHVSAVAMESTGVYWKPIFNILEGHVDHILLCNARHLKRVPGRKTDVTDSEWIAQLLQAGLLNGSFVPRRQQRELRDLTRERAQLDAEATRVVNRLHKVLQDANLKLTTYVTDIMGVSGREMLQAVADGDYEPTELAEVARGRMRSKIPQLGEALKGTVSEHHRFMIRQYLNRYDAIQQDIARFDARIAELTHRPVDPPDSGGAPHGAESQCDNEQPDNTREKPAALQLADAIDLIDTIPGINTRMAERVLAEVGIEMGQFPSANHLCSWAGLCPGSEASAGKLKGSRTRKGNRWLRAALCQAAWAAARTKGTYFHAAYKRFAARRGKKRAIVAIAHALLRSIYFTISRRRTYLDLGADWFDRLNPTKGIRSLTKRARALGFELVPMRSEPAM